MKYKLLYHIAIIAALVSCKKEEKYAFEDKPNARIEQTLEALETQLTSGDGWIANIYTKSTSGKAYSFYFEFKEANRVSMMSDIDATTASVAKESSYRLKWMQQPSLLFDTYNYIHRLADPMPDDQGGSAGVGGEAGQGLISDFEFGLTSDAVKALKDNPNADTLSTIGRYNSIPVNFYKASSEEAAFWKGGGIKEEMNDISTYVQGIKFLYATLDDGSKLEFDFDFENKTLKLINGANSSVFTGSTSFVFGVNLLTLKNAVNINANFVTQLTWENQHLFAIINGKKVQLKASDVPVVPIILLFGNSFNEIIVPNATTYPGWSNDFMNRRAQAALAIKTGGYNLDLGQLDFKFDLSDSSLLITVDVVQSGRLYIATFPYTFDLSSNGIFKFTALNGWNGNGAIIVNNMAPLFGQRLNADTFTLNYFAAPNGDILAQFTSIEHPDFAFTGTY
jgi:hypothetical protein